MSDLAERVQRVRLLLETLLDPLPTVRISLRPDAGPAASRYVPCDTCRRSGWVRRRTGTALCLACDGHGWRRRQADEQPWDAYLGLPVSEAVQLPVEAQHRREPEPEQEEAYGWERLQRAYDARGSYRELRHRLGHLAAAAPRRHCLVVAVLVEQQPRVLSEHDRRDIDLGVVWIALRMRSVRVPPWLLEHGQQQRNDEIRALAAVGVKPAEIALRLGLDKDAVRRQLRRGRQRAAA